MNLLLEGTDLQELLARAAKVGGPGTRIVRAEKVRTGGVLGFFAREAFQVAIEIPPQGERTPEQAAQVSAQLAAQHAAQQALTAHAVPAHAAPAHAAPAHAQAPVTQHAPVQAGTPAVQVLLAAAAAAPLPPPDQLAAQVAAWFEAEPASVPASAPEPLPVQRGPVSSTAPFELIAPEVVRSGAARPGMAPPQIIRTGQFAAEVVQAAVAPAIGPAGTPRVIQPELVQAEPLAQRLFVPSEHVSSSLLDLADRASAAEQAAARAVAMHTRYLGLEPLREEAVLQAAWPVMTAPPTAGSVNRLNARGPSADLAGVSEPFELISLAGLDGLPGLADNELDDGLAGVYRLDDQEPIAGLSSADDFSLSSADDFGLGSDVGDLGVHDLGAGVRGHDDLGGDDLGGYDLGPDDLAGITFHVGAAHAEGAAPGPAPAASPHAPAPGLAPAVSFQAPAPEPAATFEAPAPGLAPAAAFQAPAPSPAPAGPLIPPVEIRGIRIPTGFEEIDTVAALPRLDFDAAVSSSTYAPIPSPGLPPDLTDTPDLPGAAGPVDQAPDLAWAPVPGPRRSRATATPDPVAPGELASHAPISPEAGRPQVTALIDQLRDGARPGKHRFDGPRHTPDQPAVAELTGLPGNSAHFAPEGDQAGATIEDLPWSTVVGPARQPATAPAEAQRTMTTVTQPFTGPYNESAGIAGQAAEGLDDVAHNDFSTTTLDDAPHSEQAEGSYGDLDPAALAHARATTIVPSGRSRSRRRGRIVPSQRPSAEDTAAPATATAGLHPDTDQDTFPETHQDSYPDSHRSAQVAGTGAGTADPFAADELDDPYSEIVYGDPDGFLEPGDDLLGQPESREPRAPRSGSGWRMLRALRPRRRRDRDQSDGTWTPGTQPGDDGDSGEHWTHTGDESVIAADEPSGQPELAWMAVPHHASADVGTPGAFGQPSQLMGGMRASAAGVAYAEPQDQLALDREALRSLGVPAAWTRQLQAGDRFSSIVAVLERLPQLEIPDDVSVIAVVGPADVVELEAHRTALDLPAGGRPRAVAAVPAGDDEDRRSAVAQSKRTRPVVVAIAVDGYDDPAQTRKLIAAVKAESVIAVVDAGRSLEETTRWVEALESVDAIALDGALDNDRPAAVLSLEVPVIRVDGIAVDRIGWAALLCAQLAAIDAQRDSSPR